MGKYKIGERVKAGTPFKTLGTIVDRNSDTYYMVKLDCSGNLFDFHEDEIEPITKKLNIKYDLGQDVLVKLSETNEEKGKIVSISPNDKMFDIKLYKSKILVRVNYYDIRPYDCFLEHAVKNAERKIQDAKLQEKLDKTTGTKHDSGKPRVSLIPKAALLGAARGLTYGEKKYGTHNFRNGISYSRLADACLRHLTAWLEGENIDAESGNSHLDHALASLCMLKFMEEHRKDMDDRWLDPVYNYEEDE
jgi:hypothetical protein